MTENRVCSGKFPGQVYSQVMSKTREKGENSGVERAENMETGVDV